MGLAPAPHPPGGGGEKLRQVSFTQLPGSRPDSSGVLTPLPNKNKNPLPILNKKHTYPQKSTSPLRFFSETYPKSRPRSFALPLFCFAKIGCRHAFIFEVFFCTMAQPFFESWAQHHLSVSSQTSDADELNGQPSKKMLNTMDKNRLSVRQPLKGGNLNPPRK